MKGQRAFACAVVAILALTVASWVLAFTSQPKVGTGGSVPSIDLRNLISRLTASFTASFNDGDVVETRREEVGCPALVYLKALTGNDLEDRQNTAGCVKVSEKLVGKVLDTDGAFTRVDFGANAEWLPNGDLLLTESAAEHNRQIIEKTIEEDVPACPSVHTLVEAYKLNYQGDRDAALQAYKRGRCFMMRVGERAFVSDTWQGEATCLRRHGDVDCYWVSNRAFRSANQPVN